LRIREQAMQGIRIHLAYSLTVKMEATWSSEISTDFQRNRWCHILEDRNLYSHRSENINSCMSLILLQPFLSSNKLKIAHSIVHSIFHQRRVISLPRFVAFHATQRPINLHKSRNILYLHALTSHSHKHRSVFCVSSQLADN
jgi:hypothetical protein